MRHTRSSLMNAGRGPSRASGVPESSSRLRFLALSMCALLAVWVGCSGGGDTAPGNAVGTAGPAAGSGGDAGSGGNGGSGAAGSGGSGATGSGGSGAAGSGGSGGTGGAPCDPPMKLCDGACVAITDPEYGCGDQSCTPCDVPGGTATCAAGECTIAGCDPGFDNCDGDPSNGCEVNSDNDVENCGACGNTCAFPNANPACVAADCVIASCEGDFVDCDGDEVNGCESLPDFDPDNCGMCGIECPPGEKCEAGDCGVFCPPGQANCDGNAANGCETDLGTTDDCEFCGDECDLANASPACTMDACTIVGCDPGFEDCDGIPANGCEADTQGSALDCGGCGIVCAAGPNSTAVCDAGSCALVCDGGFEDCNGDLTDGCEQPTSADPTNCGACDNICVTPNGTPGCAAGECVVAACDAGFDDCDTAVPNGCETDIGGAVSDCGGCGLSCPAVPNGTPICTMGTCGASCGAGFGDCNGIIADGCETNTNTSSANCGGCGTVCMIPNAGAACAAGSCVIGICDLGFDDCNGAAADGCEIDLETSIADCGGCGNACSIPNGTPGCAGGSCTVATCNDGFANCNGGAADGCEINTDTSSANCGGCGNACSLPNSASTCAGGACAIASCAGGWADCNGNAVDGCEINTNTSTDSCGACGDVCAIANGTAACAAGDCVVGACNAGFADCNGNPADGCEINTQTSVNHCGSCGDVCSIANGGSSCVAGSCAVAGCNPGFSDCNGVAADGCEVNTNTSVGNCGGCGAACSVTNGTPGCSAGSCTITACSFPFANCNGNVVDGCEANTNTSLGNCGGCGTTCSVTNGSPACAAGMCGIAGCNPGFANCNGFVADGCEINTVTDANNCASCANMCSAPSGTPACVGSACSVSACNPGFADCNTIPADGCEVNTNTSTANCGGCGNTCSIANGTPSCAGGSCNVGSCNGGFANCNGNPGDGCEVNTNTSTANCGGCGNACSVANGSPSCTTGSCTIGSCNAGFANCNGSPADGCEVNTNTSVNNCGGCGNTCSFPNGVGACSAGGCVLVSCNAGFGDCNGNPADGCETNTNTSVTSCGGCGNICSIANGTAACGGGTCGIGSCNAGFANCNGNPVDGCEVNLTTSAGNCGGCGNVCSVANGSAVCAGAMCAVGSCNGGFSNCNGNPVDGCEVNTTNSTGNCGGCGNACSAPNGTPGCSASMCTVTGCNPGFSNCNGNPGDGCEVNTTNSTANCGGCGNNCATSCAGNVAAVSCNASSCGITACNPNFFNLDGSCASGCECLASTFSSACNLPTSLGSLVVGQTITHTANLVPAGKETWYVVTFTGNTNAAYHPRISFSSNPGNAFQFDIRSNCAGATLACGTEGGNSNARTDWETFKPGPNGYTQPIPAVGNGGTVLIHVTRQAGSPVTCNSFTLTISN